MRSGAVAVLALVVAVACASAGSTVAGCRGLSAQEVGEGLGKVLLEVAEAFVRADVWDNPPCDSPKTPELRQLCSLMDDVDDAVERINKSVDRKCFDDTGAFAQSADYYAYSVLQQARSSQEPKLRWQILMRMHLLCKQGVMLTDAGSRECPSTVEQACIDTLKSDADPFNRHLALEILSRSYATDSARPTLEEIVRTASPPRGLCPRGFHSRTNANARPVPWREIARGYQSSDYSCESELASEALNRLQAAKSAPR